MGKRSAFDTRVLWAVTELRKSGLLQNIRKGIFKITPDGLEAANKNLKKTITNF